MNSFNDLVNVFIDIIMQLVPIVFGITLVVLAWGIFKAWIFNGGDETSVSEGKQMALAGVIALAVMSGIWGILALLQNSLF